MKERTEGRSDGQSLNLKSAETSVTSFLFFFFQLPLVWPLLFWTCSTRMSLNASLLILTPEGVTITLHYVSICSMYLFSKSKPCVFVDAVEVQTSNQVKI